MIHRGKENLSDGPGRGMHTRPPVKVGGWCSPSSSSLPLTPSRSGNNAIAATPRSAGKNLAAGGAGDIKGSDGNVESNIHVYVRVRPLSSLPQETSCCAEISIEDGAVTLQPPTRGEVASASKAGAVKEETFRFGHGCVLDPDLSQQDFFESVGKPAAASIMEGFNVTVFAYGQTGSGKTHSMFGDETSLDVNGDPGVTGRMLEYLFTEAEKDETGEYRFSLSVLGVYDEKIIDLFDLAGARKVREGPKGVVVDGAHWHAVEGVAQVRELLRGALANRRVSETKMNARSSRSHTICCVKVSRDEMCPSGNGTTPGKGGKVKSRSAIFNMVDLCGSERVKKSDVSGKAFKEAVNINSSLSALKSVIQALGDGQAHIPYRSSKLTWLLKEGLGGNSKVVIVAHVSPSSEHRFEGLSTLRFVSFARTVKVAAKKNEAIKTVEERKKELEEESKKMAHSHVVGQSSGAADPVGDQADEDDSGGGARKRQRSLCEHDDGLLDSMEGLRQRFKSGHVGGLAYRDARAALLADWLEKDDTEMGIDAGPAHKRAVHYASEEPSKRSNEVSNFDEGVYMHVLGPEEGEEEELCVRKGANIEKVARALLAAKGLPASAKLSLWYEEDRLQKDDVVGDIGLSDGDVLQARWDALDERSACT